MNIKKHITIAIGVFLFLFLLVHACLADVVVSTNKKAYKQGEEVEIIIVNSLKEEAYILWQPYIIERYENGRWYEINIVWCPCRAACKVPAAVQIPNLGSMKYEWDQKEGKCFRSGEKKTQVGAGRYRVNIRLYPDEEEIYSEFSILSASKVLRSGDE